MHVLMHPTEFGKPIEEFRARCLNLFGGHLATQQNGPDHRRHKAVVKACFGEEILRAAWDNALRAMDLMLQEEELEEGGIMADVRGAMIRVSLFTHMYLQPAS